VKTNLIIPMAGMGYRFVKEGYKIYKPFLKYHNGNTILEGIINNFDSKTQKIFIVNKYINRKYVNNLKKN